MLSFYLYLRKFFLICKANSQYHYLYEKGTEDHNIHSCFSNPEANSSSELL